MLVNKLAQHFKEEKDYSPSHVNDLLDYLQKRYLNGELSIVEYKKLFFELDKLKAEKPCEFFIKTNPITLQYMIEA